MECKNYGKETKILVDDGIGSHVEEFDTCMKCRGWMVCDSTPLVDIHAPGHKTMYTPTPGSFVGAWCRECYHTWEIKSGTKSLECPQCGGADYEG